MGSSCSVTSLNLLALPFLYYCATTFFLDSLSCSVTSMGSSLVGLYHVPSSLYFPLCYSTVSPSPYVHTPPSYALCTPSFPPLPPPPALCTYILNFSTSPLPHRRHQSGPPEQIVYSTSNQGNEQQTLATADGGDSTELTASQSLTPPTPRGSSLDDKAFRTTDSGDMSNSTEVTKV